MPHSIVLIYEYTVQWWFINIQHDTNLSYTVHPGLLLKLLMQMHSVWLNKNVNL